MLGQAIIHNRHLFYWQHFCSPKSHPGLLERAEKDLQRRLILPVCNLSLHKSRMNECHYNVIVQPLFQDANAYLLSYLQ